MGFEAGLGLDQVRTLFGYAERMMSSYQFFTNTLEVQPSNQTRLREIMSLTQARNIDFFDNYPSSEITPIL
jgi:hypothetical protein